MLSCSAFARICRRAFSIACTTSGLRSSLRSLLRSTINCSLISASRTPRLSVGSGALPRVDTWDNSLLN
jgi:hypothetical protein